MPPKVTTHSKRGVGTGDTKGSHLSTRYTPIAPQKATTNVVAEGQATLYELLGVDNDCEADELKAAYRQKALSEHPDKGGDQDRFDAIFHAFNLLQDAEKRLEYDEELARQKSRGVLVEGAPAVRSTGEGVHHKKTAPTAGSKRQKDWHNQSEEWQGEKSGSTVLMQIRLALTDAAGPMSQKPEKETLKDQTVALFEKYKALPSGKNGKQLWVNSLEPKLKNALKAYAKEEEAKAMAKAKAWAKK